MATDNDDADDDEDDPAARTPTLYLLFHCRSPVVNLRYACRPSPPTPCLVHRGHKRLCQGPSRMEGILAAYARSLGSARQPPAAALRCAPCPCRTSHARGEPSRE